MRLSLNVKLIGSFIIVALITATVGIMGYRGITQSSKDIHILGGELIPKIINLEIMKIKQTEIKVAMRSMFTADASMEDYKRLFNNIDKAREDYYQAQREYEAIPMSVEGAKLYEVLKSRHVGKGA